MSWRMRSRARMRRRLFLPILSCGMSWVAPWFDGACFFWRGAPVGQGFQLEHGRRWSVSEPGVPNVSYGGVHSGFYSPWCALGGVVCTRVDQVMENCLGASLRTLLSVPRWGIGIGCVLAMRGRASFLLTMRPGGESWQFLFMYYVDETELA
jgi:hypothetical protein